jgi:hypothetical protein
VSTEVTVEIEAEDGTITTEQVTLPGDQRFYDTVYRRAGTNPVYSTLRQWASDAQAAFDDWPNKTAAQKDAALRETLRRLGVFMDRMADDVLIQGRAGRV